MNKNRYYLYEIIIFLSLFATSLFCMLNVIENIPFQKYKYYQKYFEAAVMEACGYGYVSVADEEHHLQAQIPPHIVNQFPDQKTNKPLLDFLDLKTSHLLCKDISLPTTLYQNTFVRHWYYLGMTIATAWKLMGVSWPIANYLVAIICSFSVGFSYLFFRLVMSRTLALLGAIFFLLIMSNENYFLFLRDYSKVPFLVGSVFFLSLLVLRQMKSKTLFLLVALFGMFIGFGYGTRNDIGVIIPLAVVTLLFFLPNKPVKWLRNLSLSLLVLIVFAIMIIPVRLPFVNGVHTDPSYQWHVTTQGLSYEFTNKLKIIPSLYEFLYYHNDHILYIINNDYAHRMENRNILPYYAYDETNRNLYLQTIKTFPADLLLRAYSAFLQTFIYQDFYQPSNFIMKMIGHLGAFLYGCLLLILIGGGQYRLGLYLTLVGGYMFSYPAIQFDPRHFYYLSFLFWFPIGFFINQIQLKEQFFINKNKIFYEIRHHCSQYLFNKRIIVFLMSLLMMIVIPLWLLRYYQTIQVKKMILAYENAPFKRLSMMRLH